MPQRKDVAYYMSLNYEKTIKAVPEAEGGGYVVTVPLLGSASTNAWGETEAEALDMLKIIMQNNFEAWINGGYPIPEPNTEKKEYSGKYLMRMTPYLHEQADLLADEQGVSLNHLLCEALAEYVGGHNRTQAVIHYVQMPKNYGRREHMFNVPKGYWGEDFIQQEIAG